MTDAKTRQSNIELFRIIVMLLIVTHHYVVNSGLLDVMATAPTAPQSIFLYIIGMWGKTGINCFVLITGWFMCKKDISLRKFLKLILWVEFYNVVIGSIFFITGYNGYSLLDLLWNLLPISSVTNTNFTTCYLLFFLFIPFLNILIHNMSQRRHALLLALCIGIYTLMPSTPWFIVKFNYISWFSVIYLVASYMRLYPIPFKNRMKPWLAGSIFSVGAAISSCLAIIAVGGGSKYFFVQDSNKILALAISICLFMTFINMKVPQNKFINTVASSAFGVLLIHANSNTMRQWLWKDICRNVEVFSSPYLYIHTLLVPVSIFAVCIIIDQFRLRFLERPILNWAERVCNHLYNKLSNHLFL